MQPIILASSSQPRKLLLERLQIPFTTVSPDIDESPLPSEQPADQVMRLAKEKAIAVANQFPDALIIGADIIGTLDNTILCKPLTQEKAVQQLQSVSGKQVRFYSGLCLYNAKTQNEQLAVETYEVYYRQLTLPMIMNYLKKENPLNCAGSLKIEGLGIVLIEKMHGEDLTSLIGLPLITLTNMLANVGVFAL